MIGRLLSGAFGLNGMLGRGIRCAQPASRAHANPTETMPTRRMAPITIDALCLVKEGGRVERPGAPSRHPPAPTARPLDTGASRLEYDHCHGDDDPPATLLVRRSPGSVEPAAGRLGRPAPCPAARTRAARRRVE